MEEGEGKVPVIDMGLEGEGIVERGTSILLQQNLQQPVKSALAPLPPTALRQEPKADPKP